MLRACRSALSAMFAAVAFAAPMTAFAGAPPAGPEELSSKLARLSQPKLRGASRAAQADALSLPRSGAGSLRRIGGRLMVEVDVVGRAGRRAAGLRAAGARVLHVSRAFRTVTASVPEEKLEALAAAPGVRAVSEVLTPLLAAACPQGDKVSEGDGQLKAALARTDFTVDGTGIKVGVLSDSFDALPPRCHERRAGRRLG